MKIQDKINAYFNTAISTTVVMVLLGLFFALLPELIFCASCLPLAFFSPVLV